MRPGGSGRALQRNPRKSDLLLASQLARGQALGAFDELTDRADAVADRVARVGRWLSNPLLWTAGSIAGVLVLRVALRRFPNGRVLRWAGLAWRIWRSTRPVLRRDRTTTGSGAPD